MAGLAYDLEPQSPGAGQKEKRTGFAWGDKHKTGRTERLSVPLWPARLTTSSLKARLP
ncbi:conserved hypothetical protein [Bacillus sp. 349Y]|nr:conserved hypothetical protein [Bacillus sp. 349Y]